MEAHKNSLEGEKLSSQKNTKNYYASFIQKKPFKNAVLLTFSTKMKEEDFENVLHCMFETALTIKKNTPSETIILELTFYLPFNWDIYLKELKTRSEDLTKISHLDFQMSGFSTMMLYDLYLLYQKRPKMQDLPYIWIVGSSAHIESESIVKQLKSEGKLGIEFLKKLVFTENDLGDIPFQD